MLVNLIVFIFSYYIQSWCPCKGVHVQVHIHVQLGSNRIEANLSMLLYVLLHVHDVYVYLYDAIEYLGGQHVS